MILSLHSLLCSSFPFQDISFVFLCFNKVSTCTLYKFFMNMFSPNKANVITNDMCSQTHLLTSPASFSLLHTHWRLMAAHCPLSLPLAFLNIIFWYSFLRTSALYMNGVTKTLNYAGLQTNVFWDMTPRSLVERYERLGETRCPETAPKLLFLGTHYLQFQHSNFRCFSQVFGLAQSAKWLAMC